jgi:hypothetical protein
VATLMRHMLFRQHQKPDQPVRRGELTSLVQGNYKARACTPLHTSPCPGISLALMRK